MVLPILVVAGCGPTGPRPAWLDASKATTIQVAMVGGGARYCAGGDAAPQVDVVVATSDGQRLDTWSTGEGRDDKLPFAAFEWTASWGQVSNRWICLTARERSGKSVRPCMTRRTSARVSRS